MATPMDEVLTAGVERGAAAGVVGIVVNRDGVVWEGAFGERHLAGGVPMTTDTVGAIFSMTKAITGAAAMHAVEHGKLDLDAPASTVLPDLADPQVLTGFDDDGKPTTRPADGDITLRNLLTHTSGFVYDIWNLDMGRWYGRTGTPSVMTRKLAALRTPLAFDPGTRWEYGIGIDWAGLMVEAVSGMTLGEYMAEHLFGPMGMADTAFAPTGEMTGRMAGMHARTPDGALAAIELDRPDDPEFEMGGGGLVSTMGDYGRFMRMVLNDGDFDGTRVLEAATVDQMAANNMGDLRVTELVSSAPNLSQNAELFPGEEKSWGLTFQVHEQDGHTGRSKGTLSWAGLANSYFWIDRTAGIAGAYLTQIMPFADDQAVSLYYDFERAAYTHLAGA